MDCSRDIPTASTSRAAARTTSGRRSTRLLEEFEHPLWKEIAAKAAAPATAAWTSSRTTASSSACATGQPTDMNVYDAAALSVICELSRTLGRGRQPASVDVPDFTRGKWKTTEPLGIVES